MSRTGKTDKNPLLRRKKERTAQEGGRVVRIFCGVRCFGGGLRIGSVGGGVRRGGGFAYLERRRDRAPDAPLPADRTRQIVNEEQHRKRKNFQWVLQPRHFLGRALIWRTTASSSSCVTLRKSQPGNRSEGYRSCSHLYRAARACAARQSIPAHSAPAPSCETLKTPSRYLN